MAPSIYTVMMNSVVEMISNETNLAAAFEIAVQKRNQVQKVI